MVKKSNQVAGVNSTPCYKTTDQIVAKLVVSTNANAEPN